MAASPLMQLLLDYIVCVCFVLVYFVDRAWEDIWPRLHILACSGGLYSALCSVASAPRTSIRCGHFYFHLKF